MEPLQSLGDEVQDGNGINDRIVCWLCVYAGNSWTLQMPKD